MMYKKIRRFISVLLVITFTVTGVPTNIMYGQGLERTAATPTAVSEIKINPATSVKVLEKAS